MIDICTLYKCNQSDFIYQIISLGFLLLQTLSFVSLHFRKKNISIAILSFLVAFEALLFTFLFIPSNYLKLDILFPFFYLRNSYELVHISILLLSVSLLLLQRNYRFKYDLFSYFLIGVGVVFTNLITLINKLLHTSPFTEVGMIGASVFIAIVCISFGIYFINYVWTMNVKDRQISRRHIATPTLVFCICLVSLTFISHIFQKDELEILKSTQRTMLNGVEASLNENIESEIMSLNLLAEIRGNQSTRPPSHTFLEASRDVILSRDIINSAYWISPRGKILWSLIKDNRQNGGSKLLFDINDYFDFIIDFPRRLLFPDDLTKSEIVETVLPYFRNGILHGIVVLQLDFQKLLSRTLKQVEPSQLHNTIISYKNTDILNANYKEIFPVFTSNHRMDVYGKVFNISISPSRFRLTEFITIIPILVFLLGFLGALLLGHTLYIHRHLSLSYDEIEKEIQLRTQELEESKQRAEMANETKTLFLANISHEIRTPLNIINGMAELLGETKLNEQQGHYVNMFKRSCSNLLRLVNDLIDISKVESGKVELHNSNFSIKAFTEEIISLYKVKANEKSIQLIVNLEGIDHEWFNGDPVRLKQIVGNVLSNSIKFTKAGGVTMKVWTVADRIHFRISDTGIGIPNDQLNSIFETFTQVDNKYTRSVGGAGLGLSISKKLIELMKGHIQVASEVGVGTTFSFHVEFQRVNTDELTHSAVKQSQDATIPDDLRILLADDSAENRELIKLFLKKYKPKIIEAENGADAFDRFQHDSFDIVLMDMQMPIIDGYNATQKIRDFESKLEKPRTPIIAITAHAMKEDSERCLRVGCNDYVPKPINRVELISTMHSHLNI